MAFYSAFQRGKVQVGTENGIRIAGLLWIVFLTIMVLFHRGL